MIKKVLLLIILVLIVLYFTQNKNKKVDEKDQWNKHYDHVVPREYPVYLDAQTPYYNEQIMYGEWPQEISSSL
jgi:hypothetical protein